MIIDISFYLGLPSLFSGPAVDLVSWLPNAEWVVITSRTKRNNSNDPLGTMTADTAEPDGTKKTCISANYTNSPEIERR